MHCVMIQIMYAVYVAISEWKIFQKCQLSEILKGIFSKTKGYGLPSLLLSYFTLHFRKYPTVLKILINIPYSQLFL